jgi:hypothetical protein
VDAILKILHPPVNRSEEGRVESPDLRITQFDRTILEARKRRLVNARTPRDLAGLIADPDPEGSILCVALHRNKIIIADRQNVSKNVMVKSPTKSGLRDIALGNPLNLAIWLNNPHQSPVVKQIAAILDVFGEVNARADPGQKTFPRPQEERLDGAVKALNRLVRASSVRVQAVRTLRPPAKVMLVHQASAGTDAAVLLMVIAFSSSGKLDLLRRCLYSECRRWFVKRKDSKFCSESCYDDFCRKTPEGRKERAAYMRKYRRDEVSRRKIMNGGELKAPT